MSSAIRKSIPYGDRELVLETGRVARQADGAVMVSLGDTVVLVTAVARKKPAEHLDFFPLTVEYQEKTYAAGKIPGGFFKREGRPNEKEVLTCRLIDRPIRPCFPKGFKHETQIIVTVLSADPKPPAEAFRMSSVRLSGDPLVRTPPSRAVVSLSLTITTSANSYGSTP